MTPRRRAEPKRPVVPRVHVDASDVETAEQAEFDQSVREAFASGRPTTDVGGASALHLQAVLAAVLGPEASVPRVGRFTVETRVQAGGMGVIFRGRDPETGQAVAIKLARHSKVERARFAREAQLLRTVKHPNVVRYLDHGETEDGHDYLVMEWLDGHDLSYRLAQSPGGALSPADTITLGLAVARGINAAHQHGVTHRDVTPRNIFLVGGVLSDSRLVDFGIAHVAPGSQSGRRLTASGTSLGSPHYMAPEQLRGEPEARTDVYGLGATLYECLAGRTPFVEGPGRPLEVAILTEAIPALGLIRDGVPDAFETLIMSMLARDPELRPRDMAAVVAELARFAAKERSLRERTERRRDAAGVSSGADFVGRVRELSELQAILDEAAVEQQAYAVLVRGPSGVGKTRLLAELSAHTLARWPKSLSGDGTRWDDSTSPELRCLFMDGLDLESTSALEALATVLHARDDVALVLVATGVGDEATRCFEAAARSIPPDRRTVITLGPLRPRAAERLAAARCPERAAEIAAAAGGDPRFILDCCALVDAEPHVPLPATAEAAREAARLLTGG
jgi:tRNA A-37 threonylcarbamoyl transferase component Bud32